MSRTVDARGLSCPEPVIQAKNAFEKVAQGEEFTILVDTEVAKENVTRFINSKGGEVNVSQEGKTYKLVVKNGKL